MLGTLQDPEMVEGFRSQVGGLSEEQKLLHNALEQLLQDLAESKQHIEVSMCFFSSIYSLASIFLCQNNSTIHCLEGAWGLRTAKWSEFWIFLCCHCFFNFFGTIFSDTMRDLIVEGLSSCLNNVSFYIALCQLKISMPLLFPVQSLHQDVENLNELKADKEFVTLEVEDVSIWAACRCMCPYTLHCCNCFYGGWSWVSYGSRSLHQTYYLPGLPWTSLVWGATKWDLVLVNVVGPLAVFCPEAFECSDLCVHCALQKADRGMLEDKASRAWVDNHIHQLTQEIIHAKDKVSGQVTHKDKLSLKPKASC